MKIKKGQILRKTKSKPVKNQKIILQHTQNQRPIPPPYSYPHPTQYNPHELLESRKKCRSEYKL